MNVLAVSFRFSCLLLLYFGNTVLCIPRTSSRSLATRRTSTGRTSRTLQASLTGLSSIADLYDQYIIDQWGVLHDGKVPYSGVVDCLAKLKGLNKSLILLSNSSKRKSSSYSGLNKVGIAADYFDDIVTSGEMAWNLIDQRKFPFELVGVEADGTGTEATDGRKQQQQQQQQQQDIRVFLIGNGDDDMEYLSTCGCSPAPPETANMILARGTFCFMTGSEEHDVKSYKKAVELVASARPWLDRCVARGLPMLVSNPDFQRPDSSGSPMPGQLGKLYEKIGGKVHYIGKPYSAVYSACIEAIQRTCYPSGTAVSDVNLSRICGVGDSLDHDVLGAKNAGLASVWTSNGVHCSEMGTTEGSSQVASESILNSMYDKYNIKPTHTLPAFKW